jgi:CHAT domain
MASIARHTPANPLKAGSETPATRLRPGAISFSNSSHFPPISGSNVLKPVMLAPGRARLCTVPAPTGSITETNTTGIVIEKATLAHIFRELAAAAAKGAPFTHVHILAHGAPLDDTDRHSPVGLSLYDEDVISGRRLATTLVVVTDCGVKRPVVVTLATCDSGKVSDVRTTDASVAHDLHDQGIPLVVASQFPLSVDGSVPFVERFYQGQLWGEHPLVSLYAVRLHLHSCMGPDTHDWASLVVYEAFPSNLTDQLEELRYWQARRAQEGALRRIEALVALSDEEMPLRAMPDARTGTKPASGTSRPCPHGCRQKGPTHSNALDYAR